MTWLLWIATTLAQEAPPAESSPEEGVSEEVIVTPDAVRRAREAVIRELEALGYDRVTDKGDRVVLKHRDTWKGKIVLYDDGYLEHRRQGIRIVEGPAKELPKGTRWLPCVIVPTACVRTGLTVSRRKLDAQRSRTLVAVEPELLELGDRLADASVGEVLMVLPERLGALWRDGAPLQGEEPLATFRARRQAILRFWESRTDTQWGDQVRSAVEGFVNGVVQESDHPFTSRELARFNAQSAAPRPFEVR